MKRKFLAPVLLNRENNFSVRKMSFIELHKESALLQTEEWETR